MYPPGFLSPVSAALSPRYLLLFAAPPNMSERAGDRQGAQNTGVGVAQVSVLAEFGISRAVGPRVDKEK